VKAKWVLLELAPVDAITDAGGLHGTELSTSTARWKAQDDLQKMDTLSSPDFALLSVDEAGARKALVSLEKQAITEPGR